jgi:hypothetical protein
LHVDRAHRAVQHAHRILSLLSGLSDFGHPH